MSKITTRFYFKLQVACFFAASVMCAQSHAAEVVNGHKVAAQVQAKAAYVKPGAPVRLMSPAEFTLEEGDALPLEVELSTQPLGETVVKLSSQSGFLLAGQTQYSSQGKSRIVMPLTVTAEAAALGYVHIWVEHTGVSGQKTTRALAIALDSRPKLLPLQYKAKVAKPYVEMQATEVIR